MITQVGGCVTITRRVLISLPFAASLSTCALAQQQTTERELIAEVECEAGLSPPLTLGMARVIVRPDAVAVATTPGGVRVFVVESGTLAIGVTSPAQSSISAGELATTVAMPDQNDEILLSAGEARSFVSRRVTGVRNPGKRPAVALDVAVFHQEPRTLLRAFTTNSGVSFQLLATASAAQCPEGKLHITLERLRVGGGDDIPGDLRKGLTLAYVDAGTLSLRRVAGEVLSGRGAAAAPYSVPGALQRLPDGKARDVTAGSTIFLTESALVEAVNQRDRAVSILVLAVRGAA